MWSQSEIRAMSDEASAREKDEEKNKRQLMLDSALKENQAKQSGEEKQKQMDIDANSGKVASEASYNNAVANNADARTAQQKLETATATKLQPGAIEAGNAASKNDAFGSALSTARNRRTAIGEKFVINSATNMVGLNDGEMDKHVSDMDKANEAAIAMSKKAGGIGVPARPRKPYKEPFTGGIFGK